MCPAGLGSISLIVLGCVTEGGEEREGRQLKAFLQGHPPDFTLPENQTSLVRRSFVCRETLRVSVGSHHPPPLVTSAVYLILLDTFIVVGLSEADKDAGCFN